MKFKVGQKWLTRNGEVVTISYIAISVPITTTTKFHGWPIRGYDKNFDSISWTLEGKVADRTTESGNDLIKLISKEENPEYFL